MITQQMTTISGQDLQKKIMKDSKNKKKCTIRMKDSTQMHLRGKSVSRLSLKYTQYGHNKNFIED